MKKILILISYYFPGFRSGGPQQSIRNLVDAFGEKLDIYIYTQNHDFGSEIPYDGVPYDQWVKAGKTQVWYASSDYTGDWLQKMYSSFDSIYCCGLFENITISLLRLHRKRKEYKAIYVAPMGVFSDGAIKIKHFKKSLFLKVGKCLKIFGGGVLHRLYGLLALRMS